MGLCGLFGTAPAVRTTEELWIATSGLEVVAARNAPCGSSCGTSRLLSGEGKDAGTNITVGPARRVTGSSENNGTVRLDDSVRGPTRIRGLRIDWMRNRIEIAQSIPPAFTEFLGRQLLNAIGITP